MHNAKIIKSDNYQGPGIYRHYKGGEYQVLGIALHEYAKENRPDYDPHDDKYHQVIYKPLTPGTSLFGTVATMWIRKLSNFNDRVCPAGEGWSQNEWVPRFKKIAD